MSGAIRTSAVSAKGKHKNSTNEKRQKHLNMCLANYKERRKLSINKNRNIVESDIVKNDISTNKENISFLAESILNEYRSINTNTSPDKEISSNSLDESCISIETDDSETEYDEYELLADIEEYLQQEYDELSLQHYLDVTDRDCDDYDILRGNNSSSSNRNRNRSSNSKLYKRDSISGISGNTDTYLNYENRKCTDINYTHIQKDCMMDIGDNVIISSSPTADCTLDDQEEENEEEGILCPCCQVQLMSHEPSFLFCFNCSASIAFNITTPSSSSSSSSIYSCDSTAAITMKIKNLLWEIYEVHNAYCISYQNHQRKGHHSLTIPASTLKFTPNGHCCIIAQCNQCQYTTTIN